MITYNIKGYVSAVVGLALITYGILFLVTQNLDSIDINRALTLVSTTISVNVPIWLFFIKWGWKCRIFYPWLVPFPDLSGKWVGELKSNWNGGTLAPIPTEVTISQTFLHIQVGIKTGESQSYSIGGSFDIDENRGLRQLFYSYLNTPRPGVRDRSEIHYGSTLLKFEGYDVVEMEGEYWTSRETTGEIILKKVKKNGKQ